MSAHPVAIVGIGCRFPGGVVDAHTFWQLLLDGRDAIGEIPAGRIDVPRFFDERPATPGRMMSRRGGFLDGIETFDAAFFGISPREAERMDPQQRLLLETAWESIEDAGLDANQLVGSRSGVFIGQWTSDFESRLFADPHQVDFMMTTGSGRYAASGRLSYALGLRGPSLTIDTACSSSLVAVHLAVRALRSGECTLALAGGANLILQPHITVAYSQSRMMAPDGRCKFGDASGDGYVRSEGVGLVALKRLDDALAAGDRIYAVIRGSAVNNDGHSSGSMGTPSAQGQEELLRTAYDDAGTDPSRVGYIEAHGTGTRAGDPVEMAALGAVLGPGREACCLIGSVKTNIGHTESAAGVAGLIKAALVLHHGRVPASRHFAEPNPEVPWAELPLRIPTQPTTWAAQARPRAAGVSAFGIAGTNAHVVLQEAPDTSADAPAAPPPAERATLLPLSARSPDALRALAGRYAQWLVQQQATPLLALCHAASTRRTPLECRAAFVADDRPALVQALEAYAAGDAAAAWASTATAAVKPRIVFVCPGQGAQWPGMVKDLLRQDADFDAAIRRCDEAARPWLEVPIRDLLLGDTADANALLERIDVVQPVLVALSIAYAQWLRTRGIAPDAVVGHSMGEVAAAQVAGAVCLADAMRIVCRRSALMRVASGRGAMALVDLPMAEAQARLAAHGERVAVAVHNSPRSCVISGEREAVRAVMQTLEAEQVFCRLVNVDVASHSAHMDEPAAALAAELAGLQPRELATPMVSTVLGRACAGHELDAGYWARNLRQPVRFAEAVQLLLNESTAGAVFIELGPHPVLLPAVQQTAQGLAANGAGARDVHTLGCGRRDEPAASHLLGTVGALWTLGVGPDWTKVHGRLQPRPFIDLPKYPWQRERHWSPCAELPQHASAPAPATRPGDDALAWLQVPAWPVQSAPQACTKPASCVVTGDDAAAVAVLANELRALGWSSTCAAPDALTAALQHDPAPVAVVLLIPDSPAAARWPLRALQSLLTVARGSRLWCVTRGAQALEATEVPAVQAAAAWGCARVVAEEHPELWGGLLDLDPRQPLAGAARVVHGELLCADGEDQVAWRGGQRHVLRWVAAAQWPPPASAPWRSDGTVLITGGLGGVGQHLAHAAVAAGARRLALLGRHALPPREAWRDVPPGSAEGRRIAAVLELEASGAAVHVAAVDVRDPRALAEFLDGWQKAAWPPIRVVVHAAGTMHNALAAGMDAAAFEAVQRPKLDAAVHLDRLLPELDLFVLVSSTGAWLAQPGQANYAAANAGLDALAQARRARGQPALSIGWGVWRDTGLVNNAAAATSVTEMERQGISSFSPEQGRSLFAWLCAQAVAPSQPLTQVAVLPIDWEVHARARGARTPAWLRARLASSAPSSGIDGSIGQRLAGASVEQRRLLLEATVREAIGQVLKLSPSRIDARKTFGSMGLSSLLAMELRNRLEAALQRPLSATLAWNHPTVEALTAYLAQDTDGAAPTHEAPVTVPVVTLDLATVADLSDAEAALALRARRSGGRR